MTASKAEQVIAALFDRISQAAPPGAVLLRNEAMPVKIPSAGLIILRDGDPGEPEQLLGADLFYFEHAVEIDLVVDRPPASRDAVFDALKSALFEAISIDRTLGGLCDYVEGRAVRAMTVPVDSGETLKAATVTVMAAYETTDPLA